MMRTARLWVIAVALALVPGMAAADPSQLVQAVGYVMVAMGNPWGYALIVAGAAYGAADARRKARRAQAAEKAKYNASLSDRTVTLLQASPPWRVVYGECRVGGDIVAEITTDKLYHDQNAILSLGTAQKSKPDALKHLVIAVAAHEVEDISEVYIAGQPVGATDQAGWALGGPADAPWATPKRWAVKAAAVSFAGGAATLPRPTGGSAGFVVASVLSVTQETGTGHRDNPITVTARWPLEQIVIVNAATGAVSGGPASGTWVVRYEVQSAQAVVRWSKHLGTDDQEADAYLRTVAPDLWSADHRLRGLAYVVITLDLEDQRFQGGPPQLDFKVKGRRVLDPRTGSTAWSANPALIIHDWLRADWGYACAAENIDVASVSAAASVCDQLTGFTQYREGTGQPITALLPRYTAHGLITTDQAKESVIEDLCNAMAGTASYGAQWRLMAGAWADPVLDLTDDDLAGPIQIIQAGVGIDDAINGIRGTYIPAGASAPTDADAYQNPVFVTADGVELWGDATFGWTDSKARCRGLQRILVEGNRGGLVVSYPAKMRAWPVQVSDRVRVTSAEYGWSAKTFRVTDWQFTLQSAVLLTLQEDDPSIWDGADAATADPLPNTDLPDPWIVVSPSGVQATSGTSTLLRLADGTILPRVLVGWAAPAGSHMVGPGASTQVRWGTELDADWSTAATVTDALSLHITGIREGVPLTVGVRHINAFGIASEWIHVMHEPVGESEPASPVVGLAVGETTGGMVPIVWTACPDVDYAATELRIGTDWETGEVIFTGAADTWSWPATAAGTYTIWARHRDRSGNDSATAASVLVTVTEADIADAVAYVTVIESTNGTEFKPGREENTMMIAHIFKNGNEVTNQLPQEWFVWSRVSLRPKPPPLDDATWNARYASGGYKQIAIDVDDVDCRAVFSCKVVKP